MNTAKIIDGIANAWGYLWACIAFVFISVALLCALIGVGPEETKKWGRDMGYPGL